METITQQIKLDTETIDIEHGSDFISIYKNVFPAGYCEHMISEFERILSNGMGGLRDEKKHLKDDYSVAILPGIHLLQPFQSIEPVGGFFRRLQAVYTNYSSRYSYLQDIPVSSTSMKMQRTDPGQGYHIWHAEAGPQIGFNMYQNRVMTYILYLNSLDEPGEAGETEFLYQRRRIPPVENTLVIWPASYTHLHRGNAVLGKRSKYIITGWFYYG